MTMMIGAKVDRVLFVDDDAMLRLANVQTLELAGLRPTACASAAAALGVIDADWPGVVVTDVRMPGMDGFAFLRALRDLDPDLPVVLITGHGDVPMAVSALKDGAWDFLTKPFGADRLVATVRRALTTRQLVLENRALRAAARRADEGDALVGEAPAMQELRAATRRLADTDVDVLIEGEPGTGKELIATMLHRWSRRRSRPFVVYGCGTLPEAVAYGELFGHGGGVLQGRGIWSDGGIVAADGGTLFVDRLDAMPLPLQHALLRAMEEREVTPLGGERSRLVNVRFVASVVGSAEGLVRRGLLREELFLHLSAARLRVPPLRERRDDVPLLFAALAGDAAARHRLAAPPLDADMRTHLLTNDWPGNVRELARAAEGFVLGTWRGATAPDENSLPHRVQRFEADAIRAVLATHQGDVRRVLDDLGIPRRTFYDKVARYGIELDGTRSGRS